MQLRGRARYPPPSRVVPILPGITWRNHDWLIMPLETFIAINRYAANLAERKADNVTLNLAQNGHLMTLTSFEIRMRNSRILRQEVARIEQNISHIFEQIIDNSGVYQLTFQVTFPYNYIRQAYFMTTNEEGHSEEELLILSDFDTGFLEDSLPPRPT